MEMPISENIVESTDEEDSREVIRKVLQQQIPDLTFEDYEIPADLPREFNFDRLLEQRNKERVAMAVNDLLVFLKRSVVFDSFVDNSQRREKEREVFKKYGRIYYAALSESKISNNSLTSAIKTIKYCATKFGLPTESADTLEQELIELKKRKISQIGWHLPKK